MLKVLAAALMLVDHVGFVLFPGLVWMRMVGRLSMPLFAYAIASGYYFTSRKGTFPKYLLQIAIFTAVSQVPFWLIRELVGIHYFGFNIGATWFLALLVLHGVFARRSPSAVPILFWQIAGIVAVGLALIIPVDYGIYGVLYPLACYPVVLALRNRSYKSLNANQNPAGAPLKEPGIAPLKTTLPVTASRPVVVPGETTGNAIMLFTKNKWFGGFCQLMLNAFGYLVMGFWQFQTLAFLAFPLMLLDSGKRSRITKWFFYIFYPAHLFALWAIASYLR